MGKEFNDLSICVAKRHYMVDISKKIEQIIDLIEKGKYFTINRPRQFGKTTTINAIFRALKQREDYMPVKISFEGVSDTMFLDEEHFCPSFLKSIGRSFKLTQPDLAAYFIGESAGVHNFDDLSDFISHYVVNSDKKIVLLIDEVDKTSNNQIFLNFLGVLRNKYILRDTDEDDTFQSVILAGVHDIKSIKLKMLKPGEERKYNSPWNIAIDFKVDLSFNSDEIGAMLNDYARDKNISPVITDISEKIHYYTSGYPYLVSKMCKFIDEDIISGRDDTNWYVDDVDKAFRMIVDPGYTTALFDDLFKNLDNNKELHDAIFEMVINGQILLFNLNSPVINLGYLYGIFARDDDRCRIHNRIFEQRIYNYLMSKLSLSRRDKEPRLSEEYYTDEGLNLSQVLRKFQQFMKENYSDKDEKFLEREGRLLFLSFLKPVINGHGFDFKEPNVSNERRMDIVITFDNRRYVVELKRWYGDKAHQKGLKQLSEYLDMYSLKEGFLLIYNFNKGKEYKEEWLDFEDKRLYLVWV